MRPKRIAHPEPKSSVLECGKHKVDTYKVSTPDYKRALELGLTYMIEAGELDPDTVKP